MTVSRRWLRSALASSAALCAMPLLAQTSATDPSYLIGEGAAITPLAAVTLLGTSGVHSNGLGATVGARPPEVRALAVGLGVASASSDPAAYADRVFDYIRNAIDTEPQFGLAKGSVGTIIDRNGTAFDQAQLMVDLLTEGGITASYKLGDVTLTAAQVASWLGAMRNDGTYDTSALGQLLGDAGIPYTTFKANYTLLHIWVTASIGANTYVYDPAFKQYDYRAGVANSTLTGSRASFISDATSGTTTYAGLNGTTVKNFNRSNISGDLTTYSVSALNWIVANAPVSNTDDIVGGRRIQVATMPAGGWRSTSLSYVASERATWSAAQGIPDAYRKKLTLKLDDTVRLINGTSPGQNLVYFDNKQFFLDEIYGRRLWINTDPVLDNFNLSLKVGNTTVATATALHPGSLTRPVHPTQRHMANLTLTVDEPYPFSSGTYLDKTVIFAVDYVQPLSIMTGIGRVTDRLAAKHGTEMYGVRELTPVVEIVEGESSIADKGPYFVSDDGKVRIGDAYLAQASRAGSLIANLNNGYYINHLTLGVSYGWDDMAWQVSQPNPVLFDPTNENVTIKQEWARLSIDSSASIRSRTALATSSNALRQTYANVMATLEGSLFEQQQDQADSASTASRAAWANDVGSASACQASLTDCASPVPLGFFFTNPSGFTALGVEANGTNELGPGLAYDPQNPSVHNMFGRGTMNVYFNSAYTQFFHLIKNGPESLKGAGGAVNQTAQADFDPAKAADILRDKFVDRSSLHGVSLASGQLTYSPGPDLVVGATDGPGGLSFQRTFTGGDAHSFGLPDGWAHNWDYSAQLSSSGSEAMGASQARAAVASIATFSTLYDIYLNDPGGLNNQVAALLVADWWRRQLLHNVVSIKRASSVQQYFRVPGGTWLSPDGDPSSVTVTGAPSLIQIPPAGGFVRTRSYAGMAVGWSSGRGDAIAFTLRCRRPKPVEQAELDIQGFRSPCNLEGYFLPTTMTDAAGRSITFNWDSATGNMLTGVSNSFGRSLSFTYAAAPNANSPSQNIIGANRTLLQVSDNAGQAVSYNYGFGSANIPSANQVQSATLPGGLQWGYTYTALGPTSGIHEVFDPIEMAKSSGRVATISVNYREDWRVSTFADAIATSAPASRAPFQFQVAEGYTGTRVDPAGGRYSVYYDQDGRAVRYIDELSRVSLATYDGWNRVLSRTAPEGDQTLFAYDLKSNVTGITQVAKPSSGQPNLSASATYDPTFQKPVTIVDFKGLTTSLSYVQSGSGRGEIQQALRPVDAAGVQPQYDFTYTALGLVDTMTTKINASTSAVTKNYYDSSGNLTKSVADNGGLNLATCYEYDAVGNRTAVIDGRSSSCLP